MASTVFSLKHPSKGRASAAIALALAAALLVPLLSGLAMSLLPQGRSALAYWWTDWRGWMLLLKTIGFAATGATVACLAALGVALSIRPKSVGGRVVLAISCLPLLVPSSLMGVGWIMALGRDAVITNLIRGLLGDATPTIYGFFPAAAATGLRYFGIAAIVFAAARRFENTSAAAETVFGLRWPARLRLRIGALSAPMLAAWLLVVLLIQSDHILPGMFLVPTFGTEILIQFNALFNPAGAAALAMVPTLFVLAAAILLARIARFRLDGIVSLSGAPEVHRARQDFAGLPTIETPKRSMERLSIAQAWRFLAATAILAVAVGLPVAGIVARAASTANLITAWHESRAEAAHSAYLAVIAGFSILIVAWILARAWAPRSRSWRTDLLLPSIALNIAVPGSLLALGLLALPWPRAILDSEIPLIAAYVTRFAPVAAIVMVAGWGPKYEWNDAAARVHEVPPFKRLIWLDIPTRAPAAVAALWLTGLMVAAELEMSLILVRPGPTTLGVRLYTLIHTAPDHMVAALAVDVLLLVFGTALVGAVLFGVLARKVLR